jgi:cobalt-zinc-cadmium efflux system outer membrane protein
LHQSISLCACMVIAIGATGTASAQQSQPQKLSLASALDLAEKHNLNLLAARAQRAVALAGVRIAGERPNPTASVGVLRDTPHESLFFDQPIELGSKRRRRIDLAQQEGALTETDISALERQVRRNVRLAYFGLAFARGATAERARVLKLARRLQDIAQARFQAGDIPQLEVTQSQLEVARADADAQVAQQEERVALGGLNALLNEPALTDWDLGDTFATLPPAMTLDDLLARAGISNSEIARISQEEKVEQSRKRLFEAQRIPNLGLEFGVDFNAPKEFRVGPRGQLTLELPIFSRRQGEIAHAAASESALERQMEAQRRAVTARVESAYWDLEARRSQVRLYRDALLPSSQHLEEMAEESYRAGKANILTVLGAQHDVQQVERDYLDSLLVVQSAFAHLEETVGAPLD